MLRIRKDALKILKSFGYNSRRLRKEGLLAESTMTRIRRGEDVHLSIVGRICDLTGLEPSDIIEYEYEPYSKGGE